MKENKRSICHCAHCLVEPDCAYNDWSLINDYDPCCPNWKNGYKEFKQFLKDYMNQKL